MKENFINLQKNFICMNIISIILSILSILLNYNIIVSSLMIVCSCMIPYLYIRDMYEIYYDYIIRYRKETFHNKNKLIKICKITILSTHISTISIFIFSALMGLNMYKFVKYMMDEFEGFKSIIIGIICVSIFIFYANMCTNALGFLDERIKSDSLKDLAGTSYKSINIDNIRNIIKMESK